jgi:plastocyanin
MRAISLFLLCLVHHFALAKVYDHHSFEKFKAPQRDLSIIVGPEGYFPDRIIIFEGEKVRFFVTSTMSESRCFIVENHQVFVPANKGRIAEAEVVFDKAGEYGYFCPSFSHKGKLIVLGERERAQPVVKVNRDPASSSTLRQNDQGWVPKEY